MGFKKKRKQKILFRKKVSFKNFIESQNFVNKVGNIAENEGHHPDISYGWGYATIRFNTFNPGLSKMILYWLLRLIKLLVPKMSSIRKN